MHVYVLVYINPYCLISLSLVSLLKLTYRIMCTCIPGDTMVIIYVQRAHPVGPFLIVVLGKKEWASLKQG